MMLKLQTSISNQPFKCCLHLLRRRIRNSSSSTTIDDPSIFIRYAFSVQYHGGNSLGFSYQGPKAENCIVYHPSSLSDRAEDADATHNEDIILSAPKQQTIQADLRGLESIEGRIRRALDHLVGRDGYQNIRVSSRTDRGVHAWRNTFHVDIRASVIGKKILQLPVLESLDGDECETISSSSSSSSSADDEGKNEISLRPWKPVNLVHGLNFYLSRLSTYAAEGETSSTDKYDTQQIMNHQGKLTKRQRRKQSRKKLQSNNNNNKNDELSSLQTNSDICILSSAIAPSTRIPNMRFDPTLPENENTNPKTLQWDARFTATRRVYAYRILHSRDDNADTANSHNDDNETELNSEHHHATACYHSHPFEHDRVWRIHDKGRSKKRKINSDTTTAALDVNAMNRAGRHLVGTHDFTSFRGKGCQRSSPIVTLEDVWVGSEPYHGNDHTFGGGVLSGVFRTNRPQWRLPSLHRPDNLRLITVVIAGKSFLYHQVRNIVACLVEVGRGRLTPEDVKEILEKRDRSAAPGMAPAEGLFLVDVEHGDFRF